MATYKRGAGVLDGLSQASEEQKRTRRRKGTSGPAQLIPLPRFSIENTTEVRNIVTVRVQPQPALEERNGLTWVVDARPSNQLGKGQYILLETNDQQSGIGRLEQRVVGLKRHWIVFAISGAPNASYLRVPTPWAALDALEGLTHSRHYFSLPALPCPHPSFRSIPAFADEKVNPYEFDVWDEDIPELERRLYRIGNYRPQALRVSSIASNQELDYGPSGGRSGSSADVAERHHNAMRTFPIGTNGGNASGGNVVVKAEQLN
ncbi:hypothetical protein C8Q72DRAFT_792727 [Fomitopsis betulina]|nr:hypothetical protein C8Q72DRAFT_792727 [Fomitopsis betulina]